MLHVKGTPEGTVQAYEPDANFDQAITLAYSDMTDEAAPAAGRQAFTDHPSAYGSPALSPPHSAVLQPPPAQPSHDRYPWRP